MARPASAPHRLAAGLLATLLVVAISVARPAVAYALGTSVDPTKCANNADSSARKGTVTDAWHISRLHPSEVWAQNDANGVPITGAKITVAVVDTAAQVNVSPYLSSPGTTTGAKPTWQMMDYVGDDLTKAYQNGLVCDHGTRVVSLINGQAQADSTSNFSGMAPGSSVVVMRALTSSTGTQPQGPTAAAVRAAADMGVDIINISQAGGDNDELRDAVAYAIGKGVVVVASAGNAGDSGATYPAAYPGVIAVGMTTTSDGPHPSSEQGVGLNIAVAAPGDAIVALLPSDPTEATTQTTKAFVTSSQIWNTEAGTSFAAPIVTGVVALMLQKAKADGVTLSPAEVKRRLEVTADPPPGAVPDAQLGYGTVNPVRAVFGPFPGTAATPTPTTSASSTAGPLPVPSARDTTPMIVAVSVTLGVLVLLFGGVLVREALPPMRKRRYAPARPDE